MQRTSINHIQVFRLAKVFDIDGGIDATIEKKIDYNTNQKMDSSDQESTNYSIERSCDSDSPVEFSMVSVPECFIKSELIESTEMLSNQERRLELQKQTKDITGTTINNNSIYKCIGIGMGLNFGDSEYQVDGCRLVVQQLAIEQQQLTENSCSLGITPIVCTNTNTREDQMSNTRDRQLDGGVFITKIERVLQQNTSDQSYIQIARSIEDQSSDRSHSWSTEQLNGCIKKTGLERRLQDQPSDSLRNNAKTPTLPLTRCLCDSNHKTIQKVLLAIEEQKSRSKTQSVQHSMEQRVTTTSPTNRVNSKSHQETQDGTSNCLIYSAEVMSEQIQNTCSYDNLRNRPGKSGDDTRKGQITRQIESETTTRKPFCSSSDKYSAGEQLYRELAQLAGLDQQGIQQMIDNSNWETWRKRRQRLTLMSQYIKLRNIKSEQLIAERPDIHVVNAMAWINELEGKSRKSNLISLKTHVSSMLLQFPKMPKISESELIRNFTRCLNLNMESRDRYDVVWYLDRLLDYIEATDFRSPYEVQLHLMSLLVIFYAARMTELSRMQLSDINQEQDKCMILNTQIRKGNRVRNEQIKLNKTNTKLCLVNTLRKWIDKRRSVKQVGDSVFWNFNKSKSASSTYCSQSLTSLLRNAGIQQPYNGPSI
ncbi:MAG: hypothetical protein EZS28_002974 [Streblomastix strix]|uniref:Tyr recombinase domain-containing protein n=1 Tax=Streblomastix strix TaxID=222440 RepID=A0A5J4X2K1_9EUKA|nr:MAG: hypothetical protein EZS28_002974 [Streblomastix strix]